MNKHTPGPWKAGEMGDRFIVFVDDGTNTSTTIADEIKDEEDARLIAASPELLDALVGLLNMPEFDGTPEASLLRRDSKRAARAAIAKAEGSG